MLKNNTLTITAKPGSNEMRITRILDAPRELVFKAFTDQVLYVQWIGPRVLTTNIERFEARNGGSWRYVQKDKEGNQYAFHGVFHEVLAPSRIIQTFEFEGLPETGHAILQTDKFEEMPDGRTRLETQALFQSVEDRDGMLSSGMEEGMTDSYSRLDELLEKMKKGNS